jgi:hypothetical protein
MVYFTSLPLFYRLDFITTIKTSPCAPFLLPDKGMTAFPLESLAKRFDQLKPKKTQLVRTVIGISDFGRTCKFIVSII